MADMHPRLLITAPASGGGKTTLMLGLLQALQDRGLRPAAFKCGPDYIDPLFHREVLGVDGYNLDLYFSKPEIVRGLLAKGAACADVSIVEGVMGYYDGIGAGTEASSWQVALATATPSVMVVNPRGAFLSLAALVNGFRDFRPDSCLRGLVLSRCDARYHEKIAPVLEKETGLRVYGYLPEIAEAVIPSRHLGLVTPDAVTALRHKLAVLGRAVAQSIDVGGLLDLAASAPAIRDVLPAFGPAVEAPVRVAVARDAAFCFYYRENLELLQELGADLAYFSPLADAALPAGTAGLYLGGGYPELFGEKLSANASMRHAIVCAIRDGMPVLAECGGFLYLQESLRDKDEGEHAMVSALPGTAMPAGGLRRFGYIELTQQQGTLLGPAGTMVRGHEFHYWESSSPGAACRAVKPGSGEGWECVHAGESLFAGFPHLYLWSNPECAVRFVTAAEKWSGGQGAKA